LKIRGRFEFWANFELTEESLLRCCSRARSDAGRSTESIGSQAGSNIGLRPICQWGHWQTVNRGITSSWLLPS